MKELSLSIEEKAKRYDEALKAAVVAHKDEDKHLKATLERIFPELKESEDEKIRKYLIHVLCDCGFKYNDKGERDKALAWLEKQGEKAKYHDICDKCVRQPTCQSDCFLQQGEQKPTLPKWKYKKDNTPLLRDSLILNKYGCVAKSPSGAIVSDVWIIDYDELAKLPKEESEKQGEQNPNPCDGCINRKGCINCENGELREVEQKPADKDEPKFKVGDWVVYENRVGLIIRMLKEHYIISFDMVEEQVSFTFNDRITKWTIKDAKDGDVLCGYPEADYPWIGIFYKLNAEGAFSSYCYLQAGLQGKFCPPSGENIFGKRNVDEHSSKDVVPATKEQRDLLFQKMKEAGYEWDAEKKELRKIEQNPIWSEEDEITRNALINLVEMYYGGCIDKSEKNRLLSWLKGLKDRVQPQSKQEWSEDEKAMIDEMHEFFDKHKFPSLKHGLDKYVKFLESLKPQNT